MITASGMLWGMVAPAVVALLCLSIVWQPWRAGPPQGGAGGGAVALAAGYAVAHAGLLGQPGLPPVDATHWVFWLAFGGAALAVAESGFAATPAAWRWAVRLLLAAATAVFVLWPRVTYAWEGTADWLWPTVLALALVGLLVELELVTLRAPASSGWAVIAVVAGGAALGVALSGSQSLGQLAGGLATAAAAATVLSLFPWGRPPHPSAARVAGLVVGGILLGGSFYAELPVSSAVLLAVAPLPSLLVPSDRLGRWGDLAARVVLTAVPVAIAVALALRASPSLEPYMP